MWHETTTRVKIDCRSLFVVSIEIEPGVGLAKIIVSKCLDGQSRVQPVRLFSPIVHLMRDEGDGSPQVMLKDLELNDDISTISSH